MASVTYTASTLKTCRNGSSWRSDYPYAGIGQSLEYDSISRIGYLGFDFNLTGKSITKISFTFSFDSAGVGAWYKKSMDFYRYVSSTSPTSTVGSRIGGFSSVGMYSCTTTFTFDSSTNADCFNGLKAYFEAGGSELIIKAPVDDSRTHSYGNYTDSYALIKTAKVTIEYVDKHSLTYFYRDSTGKLTSNTVLLPSGVASSITTDIPATYIETADSPTVYFDGNGGTASKQSDWSTATYTKEFDYWEGSDGSLYAPGGQITLTGDFELTAIYYTLDTSYDDIMSPTASKPDDTETLYVVLNFNDSELGDAAISTLVSSSDISYTCTGWYTAATGGVKRVDTETAFTPTNPETLYAQYSSVATDFTAVTLPTPTKEGHVFGGWVDDYGNVVSETGGLYIPSSNITLTASWVANIYTVTINDWLNSRVIFVDTVAHGTIFTIPTFDKKRIEQPAYGNNTTVNFIDDQSSYSTATNIEHLTHYRFDNTFGMYIDGIFAGGGEGDIYNYAGDEVTIIGDTEFSFVWTPVEDGFIKFTTPSAPSTIFGKLFKGWQDNSTGKIYAPNAPCIINEPAVELTLVGVWVDISDRYGKNLFFKVNGEMKQGTAFVKADGQYREAIAIFTKVNGVWKTKERVTSASVLDSALLDEIILAY